MRAALVRDQVVENVIMFDGHDHYEPPPGLRLVIVDDADPIAPGWRQTSTGWAPPATPSTQTTTTTVGISVQEQLQQVVTALNAAGIEIPSEVSK